MLNPKQLQIKCTGYSVSADWYEGERDDEVLLSLIGWTSNRGRDNDLLSAIVSNTGMSALVFDYSGHGDSPFVLEETYPAQQFLEAMRVFDWLKENYPDAKINVMGTSYGGYIAAQLTQYRAFEKLILRAPAIYPHDTFYTKWKEFDEQWTQTVFRRDLEALAKHPLIAGAGRFKGKTFVMVHEKDEDIPRATTDAYIKAFNADSHVFKNTPHSLRSLPRERIEEYQKIISKWLSG